MSSSSVRSALIRGGFAAAAAILVCAAVALAASQVKSASYGGSYGTGATATSISFKVSATGSKVIDLSVQTPIKCNGGCGGFSSPSGGTAKISKKGTFTAVLSILGAGSSKKIGTDTVTGTFLKSGKAKGTVASHFNSGSSSDRTVSWTARVTTAA